MINKIFLLSFLFVASLFSEEEIIDTTTYNFEKRQELLKLVNLTIREEESIARSYEEYILENYRLPTSGNINSLLPSLGTSLSLSLIGEATDLIDTLKLNISSKTIDYRLKDLVKKDTYVKQLYESDSFRKNTFYYNGKIHIILKSDFAKNIYNLIKAQGKNLYFCDDPSSGKYCIKRDLSGIKKDHINIYETSLKNKLLIYYFPEMYEKGPIIIINDISYYDNDEFKQLPIGVILYDFDGEKYLKTKDAIRKVN